MTHFCVFGRFLRRENFTFNGDKESSLTTDPEKESVKPGTYDQGVDPLQTHPTNTAMSWI